ncbi:MULTISPECIES: ABC transporter permease [Actibacterium]|uniref:Ribose transport system permease protein n=1 Tax=Actibacterium naphthalenivorans TaxID=1614693 RepID=A0A840CKE2_9RHOB|nr:MULTISPECIES: ABC transporter permease [Actibacterium]ALG90887.1 ABC transporter permease [Actibacterium sp. EMB200-NS6]MBB4023978.1 ribose transport system permease protein [Actibacterium naphthalenivorans]
MTTMQMTRSFFLNSAVVGLVMIALLLAGFSAASPQMLTKGNIYNILVQSSYLMIFASAQSMVLLTRGYDLSLGNTVSLVSVITAMVLVSPWGQAAGAPILLAALCGLGAAVLIGGLNGTLVAATGLNPFIVTLGTMYIVQALGSTVSGGFPVSGVPAQFMALSRLDVLGVPVQIWTLGLATLALHMLLKWSVYGRSLYLVGANPTAATTAGVKTRMVTAMAYVCCSAFAGLGAILLTARTGSGEPTLGANLTLEAIAAAVVGGISTQGGRGGAVAPLIGAVLITLLSNGMDLVQIDGYVQQICLGMIILIALTLDRFRR